MTEKPVSTPAVKKDFAQITSAAAASAVMAKEEFVDANTPRESSGANSPPSPPNGLVYGPRKRKYEEATEDEKHALNAYHTSNPHLKQRELAEWFRTEFGKSINQSTVSRNLKKFKASPSSKEQGRPDAAASASVSATPTKRERKLNGPPRSPLQKKIQINKQLPPPTPSAVSLPPTPPPRDNRASPIDSALYEFYLNFRKLNPDVSPKGVDREIKFEAQKLLSNMRLPPPPTEKIDGPVIDDAWVANWKRVHGIPGPTSSTSADSFAAPTTSTTITTTTTSSANVASEADRTCSEETEPRSPVSTVSSSDHGSLELPPIRESTNNEHTQSTTPGQANGLGESPDSRRRRQIETLKKDIEKRDRRIEHEQRKKELALSRLEKLERAGKQ
ncbi:hypothetical protein BZA05DRAFT_417862 [Tricharina praecox]|uniref:uncharacterized protein n=1 Tax=Tricharina praecox TaxID=43433 RepID=UPI0022202783|nr:uncharacterized protein BZA05DRAFT_417862 [Tricharina praecox]KAI5853757.1 hypothetical protein BZA05DRAFT_417862 [Tricharina praecox]